MIVSHVKRASMKYPHSYEFPFASLQPPLMGWRLDKWASSTRLANPINAIETIRFWLDSTTLESVRVANM